MSIVGGVYKPKISFLTCLFHYLCDFFDFKLCDNHVTHYSDFKVEIFIKSLAHAQ